MTVEDAKKHKEIREEAEAKLKEGADNEHK